MTMEGHDGIIGLIFSFSNQKVLVSLRKWSGFSKISFEKVEKQHMVYS